MKFQVRVEGHKELRRSINQAKNKGLAKELREAHKQTANVVVPPARSLAPHLSGKLSASIKPSSSVKGAVVRAGSGNSANYAGPIHFGWPKRGIKPQPFLFRAAYARREEYAALFQELMSALVRRHVDTD
ncbi:MAG: hypothetical protein ABIQ18_39825 [Umezawaea sp.]